MSDSEISELTDIEDELDDGVEGPTSEVLAKGKMSGKNTGAPYRVKGVLPLPRATSYTPRTLHEQMCSGDVDLEPAYQRDVVWTAQKQIGIIDSIYRNFYIPPIIFAVKTNDDGSETRTCIDGKQRLTSIYRFMEGLIPHKDPMTNEKNWYKDAADGKARTILSQAMQKLFAHKQIVCVEYHGITEDSEREIFQRVQLGMALTPAEKLQVIKSPRSDFIRTLLDAYVENDGPLSGDTLTWDTRRGTDFRCLSIAAFHMEKPSSAGFSSLSSVSKWISDVREPSEAWYEKVGNTLALFAHIAKDQASRKAIRRAGDNFTAIEFIVCAILISTHKNTMSVPQLAWSIGEMRKELRVQFQDVRLSAKVSKAAISFINGLKSKKIGGAAGKAAYIQVSTPSRHSLRAREVSRNPNKRKRQDEDEDEQEDEDEDEREDGEVAETRDRRKTPPKPTPPKSKKTAKPNPVPESDAQRHRVEPPLESASSPAQSSAPVSAPRLSRRMAAIQAAKEAAENRSSFVGSLSTAQDSSALVASTSNSGPPKFSGLPSQRSALATQSLTSAPAGVSPSLLHANFPSTPSDPTPSTAPQLGVGLEENLTNMTSTDTGSSSSPRQSQHHPSQHYAPSPLRHPAPSFSHESDPDTTQSRPQPSQWNSHRNTYSREQSRERSRDRYSSDRDWDRDRDWERERDRRDAWDRDRRRDSRDWDWDTRGGRGGRGWGRGRPMSGTNADGYEDSRWRSRNGR